MFKQHEGCEELEWVRGGEKLTMVHSCGELQLWWPGKRDGKREIRPE